MARVLIVDDNASIVMVTRIVLERSGFEVETAEDERVFAIAESWGPSVILMDVRLPLLNGVEACSRLKSNPATLGIPVVLMTASHNAEELARAAGADGVLHKPFSNSELIETINECIGQREASGRTEAIR